MTAYDQTHGPYGQAHALEDMYHPVASLLKKNTYIIYGTPEGLYMVWFMVWINLTKGNATKHMAMEWLVWYVLANKNSRSARASS
jgi:hypothetical protein